VAPKLTQSLSGASLTKFKVLQQHFVAGLAVRWRAIVDAATPQELETTLHRLCGAAGSYGFDRLSECARIAELLSASHAGPALTQALARLETEINLARTLAQVDPPDPGE
jgi:HPt (histidine-containing phosphotransfer) domain-containing protein